jgi:hypothetical protein
MDVGDALRARKRIRKGFSCCEAKVHAREQRRVLLPRLLQRRYLRREFERCLDQGLDVIDWRSIGLQRKRTQRMGSYCSSHRYTFRIVLPDRFGPLGQHILADQRAAFTFLWSHGCSARERERADARAADKGGLTWRQFCSSYATNPISTTKPP